MKTAKLSQTEDLDDALPSDELPEGWVVVPLGDLIAPSREKVEPERLPEAPYLSLEHIESGTNKIVGCGVGTDVKSTKAVFRSGDILYGKLRPYLNKVCVPDFNGICSTDLLVFPQIPWVRNRFLMWFLSLPRVVEYANHHSKGIELPRINFNSLALLEFPLPPLAEQIRIVAKVEPLLAEVNRVLGCLEKVPKILKAFRQSVLAAACSGRLTEDWRDAHALVESMKASDADRGDSEDYKIQNEQFIESLELPDSWEWGCIGQFADVKGGKRLPKGMSLVEEDTGFSYIRAGNLKDGTVKGAMLYLPPPAQKKIARYIVASGDVYITIVGACIGDAGVIPSAFDGANLTENAAKITNLKNLHSPFLSAMLRSPRLQHEIEDRIHSGSQGKLALHRIAALPIPVPPTQEQHEIVRVVEALFKLADTIEKQVESTTKRAEKITQAILAKAFRGELVPTEAELARRESRSYEPASILLERIKCEDTTNTDTATLVTRPRRRRVLKPHREYRESSG